MSKEKRLIASNMLVLPEFGSPMKMFILLVCMFIERMDLKFDISNRLMGLNTSFDIICNDKGAP